MYAAHYKKSASNLALETFMFSHDMYPLKLQCNRYAPPCGKTNNVVSEQVRHKPSCTVTEAG